ncbi:MAG: hypothetical protein Q8N51_17635 [Gammaproteobacteria bacterium]|nr:hypothetical protein [Gammaproteobacteria bacterium]
MFQTITPSAIISTATPFANQVGTIVLIVVGFGVTLILANWVAAKFRGGGGAKRKRRKK